MLPPPAMRSDVDGVCVWVPFLDDAPFRSGKAHAFVGGDRPDEGGEFARDGDIDDIGWFSGPDEPAVLAQSRTCAFHGNFSLRSSIWTPIRAGRR